MTDPVPNRCRCAYPRRGSRGPGNIPVTRQGGLLTCRNTGCDPVPGAAEQRGTHVPEGVDVEEIRADFAMHQP